MAEGQLPSADRLVAGALSGNDAPQNSGVAPAPPPAANIFAIDIGRAEHREAAYAQWQLDRLLEAIAGLPRAYLANLAGCMLEDTPIIPGLTEEQRRARRRLAITIQVCAARHNSPNGIFDASARADLVRAMQEVTSDSLNVGSEPLAFHPGYAMNVVVPGDRSLLVLAHLVASGELTLGINRQIAQRLIESAAASPSTAVRPCGQNTGKDGATSSDSQDQVAFSSFLADSVEACEAQKSAYLSRLRVRSMEEQATDELRALPAPEAVTRLTQANLALIEEVRREIGTLRSLRADQLSQEIWAWFRDKQRNLAELTAHCERGIKVSRQNIKAVQIARRQGAFDEATGRNKLALDRRNLDLATAVRQRIETIRRQVANALDNRPLPAGFQLPSALVERALRAQTACRSRLQAGQVAELDASHQRRLQELSHRLGARVRRLRAISCEAHSDDVLWIYLEKLALRAEELADIGEQIAADEASVDAQADSSTVKRRPAMQELPVAPPKAIEEPTASKDELENVIAALTVHLPSRPPPARGLDDSWIDERFARGTFASSRDSAWYHFRKHGRHETGETLPQYIGAAQRAREQFTGLVERSMSQPGELLRLVDTRETYLLFTAEGKIVSYRDRRPATKVAKNPEPT